MADDSRTLRSRILSRASRIVSPRRARDVANASKDQLLIEAQKATYREMHQRFTEKAVLGERGLDQAIEAMDAMWRSIRYLRAGAPTIVGTLNSGDDRTQVLVDTFFVESTELLEDAIRMVFAEDLGRLTLPPARMAFLIRVTLQGLIFELAHARTAEQITEVDNAYADVRTLFERFVLANDEASTLEPLVLEPIPLPW